MLAIQPTWPPLAADDICTDLCGPYRFRDSSGHVGNLAAGVVRVAEKSLQVLLLPRPGHPHHTWRRSSAAAKLSSHISNSKKFKPNGLLVSARIAAVQSRICSWVK
jgi:hypothetical protein